MWKGYDQNVRRSAMHRWAAFEERLLGGVQD